MSLFCRTQRKIFWRMWETEQFWGTIDFHSIFFSYYGSQWCPKTAWLQQTFFKISSFVFGRTKKFIQLWNYLRVSKWWENLHFWVNYPFKSVNTEYLLNTLFSKRLNWVKTMLQKISISNNLCSIKLSVHHLFGIMIMKKCPWFHSFHKNLKQHNIDNNKDCTSN